MANQARTIPLPADWWEAFQDQARREGLELSAWIGEACKARLSAEAAGKLSERAPERHPHRTKHIDPGNDLPRGAKG